MTTVSSVHSVQIWGHRGAMDCAPMNTLSAFKEAIVQGSDGVELDVHLSADGQVMVIHDASVDATTNGSGMVDELSLEQLKTLDAGAWFDARFTGERIPTLLEVLGHLPANLVVNIEIKTRYLMRHRDMLALVGLTLDVVRVARCQETVIFSSFDPRAIRILAKLAPEIDRALLIDQHRPWWMALLSLGLDIQAIHPHFSRINRRVVEAAHAKGHKVNVWTVNQADEAKRLVELGVDAIISNRPGEIRQAIEHK